MKQGVGWFFLALLCSGCGSSDDDDDLGGGGNSIVGTWQAPEEVKCGTGEMDRTKFTVDSALNGSGGFCRCDFTFTSEEVSAGKYVIDVKLQLECGFLALYG